MLPYAVRKALFFLFVGIFLISAPLVVLYTAGYRFNRANNTVSQTGTLSIASTPRGATTNVNGEDINDATPAVLQRLSSGTRTVKLTKDGYHDWERTVNVESGSTTYVTAPLFASEEPVLLAQGGADWERATTARTSQLITLPDDILFTATQEGVEVSLASRSESTLLTLLQSEIYSPVIIDDEYLFVQNSKGELFYISLTNAQAARSLGKDVVTFAWDRNEKLLIFTDGLEVHIFSPATNTQELITRQSDPITALTFAHGGESIVLASRQGIIGIDLISYVDGRMQTPLASFTEATTVWFAEDGSTAYLETVRNLSSLVLAP
jgi:hypothetical protein